MAFDLAGAKTNEGSDNTRVVARPDDVEEGDLLWFTWGSRQRNRIANITMPTGVVHVVQVGNTGSALRPFIHHFLKVATDSEPDTYEFSSSETLNSNEIAAARITGVVAVDLEDPVVATVTDLEGSTGGTWGMDGVSGLPDKSYIRILGLAGRSLGATCSPSVTSPGTMEEVLEGANVLVAVQDFLGTSAAATSGGFSSNAQWAGADVILEVGIPSVPPSAPGAVNLGGDEKMVGESVPLEWDAATHPDEENIQYEGQYRRDGGAWTELFELQAAPTFAWNTTGFDAGDYEIRVRAFDGGTGEGGYGEWGPVGTGISLFTDVSTYSQDFGFKPVGAFPGGWTRLGAGGGWLEVRETAQAGNTGGKWIQRESESSDASLVRILSPDILPAFEDGLLRTRFYNAAGVSGGGSNLPQAAVVMRLGDIGGEEVAYIVSWCASSPNSFVRIARVVDGVFTNLASFTLSGAAEDWWIVEADIEGTTIRGRAYVDGDAVPEWQVSHTADPADILSDGRVGLGRANFIYNRPFDTFFAESVEAPPPGGPAPVVRVDQITTDGARYRIDNPEDGELEVRYETRTSAGTLVQDVEIPFEAPDTPHVIEGLDDGTTYHTRAMRRFEAGWSEWGEVTVWSTFSSAPPPEVSDSRFTTPHGFPLRSDAAVLQWTGSVDGTVEVSRLVDGVWGDWTVLAGHVPGSVTFDSTALTDGFYRARFFSGGVEIIHPGFWIDNAEEVHYYSKDETGWPALTKYLNPAVPLYDLNHECAGVRLGHIGALGSTTPASFGPITPAGVTNNRGIRATVEMGAWVQGRGILGTGTQAGEALGMVLLVLGKLTGTETQNEQYVNVRCGIEHGILTNAHTPSNDPDDVFRNIAVGTQHFRVSVGGTPTNVNWEGWHSWDVEVPVGAGWTRMDAHGHTELCRPRYYQWYLEVFRPDPIEHPTRLRVIAVHVGPSHLSDTGRHHELIAQTVDVESAPGAEPFTFECGHLAFGTSKAPGFHAEDSGRFITRFSYVIDDEECDPIDPPDPVETASDFLEKAWAFVLDGHVFYVLNFNDRPALVCDLTTGQWHSWFTREFDPLSIGFFHGGYWNMFRGIVWKGRTIAADISAPIVWELDPHSMLDEETDVIRRAVTAFQPVRGSASVRQGSLRLTARKEELGEASTIRMRFSDDGGHTWSRWYTVVLAANSYSKRIEWRSLGRLRAPGRLWEIEDAGGLVRIEGTDTDLEGG